MTDGFDSPLAEHGSDVWADATVQKQMSQSGGLDGILERVNAFLATADIKR